MTNLEGPPHPDSGPIPALEAVALLYGWLRELRAELATLTVLSRPATRRIERALVDLEDLLSDVRSALVLLAFERSEDGPARRGIVVDRCTEMLATWRAGMEGEDSRRADHARDFFARFMPCLAEVLEDVVRNLSEYRSAEVRNERRAEEERRLLARPDLPVM